MRKITGTVFAIFFTAVLFCQSDESSNLSYGMKLYEDKIYDVAITQFRNFLEQYGTGVSAPKVQYFLAESYVALNDTENALRSYQKLILDHPRSEYCEAAILKTASLYEGAGDKEKAARYYLQLKNYFPRSNKIPEAYYKAVSLFRLIDMNEQAKENSALLQKSYPNNNYARSALLIIAGIYESEGQIKLAERTFSDVFKTATDELKSVSGLEYASFLERQNNLSEAKSVLRESFKASTKKDANYYPVLIRLAGMLLMSGTTEASAILDAEKNFPDEFRAELTSMKGDIEFFKQNYKKALEYFEDSFARGNNVLTQLKIAHTLKAVNDKLKAAETFYSAAMTLSGNEKETDLSRAAFISASENYLAAGNQEKGVAALKKYLELFPKSEDSHKISFMIGRSYYDSGRYLSASEILQNHPLDFPVSEYSDDAVFLAAESYFKAEEWKKSNDYYKYLNKNFPASSFSSLAVKRMKYLNDYKLRENDISDKLADLSSRSIFEENKTRLYFDWSKLYFYDLKDFAKAAEFIEKYSSAVKGSVEPEAKFIRSVSRIRLKSEDKENLSVQYRSLSEIFSDTNSPKNLRYKAALEMLSVLPLIFELTELELAADNIIDISTKDKLDDGDGTIAFKCIAIKAKNASSPTLVTLIDNLFGKRTVSVYYYDIEFLRSEIFRTAGNEEKRLAALKNITGSESAGLPVFQSLLALSSHPAVLPENRLEYLSRIESSFYYALSKYETAEKKANVYLDGGMNEKALSVYIELDKELSAGNLSSSWNFSDRDYSKNIADIYFKTGDINKAETYYQRALANRNASPDRQQILLRLSEIYKSQNNKTALEENYKLLGASGGGESGYTAALALADIELEKNNITKAITQYNDILKKFKPEDRKPVELRIIKANFAKNSITEGDNLISDFRKKYKDAYEKEVYEPEFYLSKSGANLSLKEYDKALKGYRALLKDFPSSPLVPKALYGEAVVLYNIGKKDDAFGIWSKLVEKYPDDDISVETNYHLGAIYNNREEFDKAITAFQNIIKFKKDHPLKKNSYKHIIDLYTRLSFNDASARMIREYVSNYPDEDDVFQKRIEIGNIYQRNEEYEAALDYFQRLLYEAKGDDEAACQFFIAETYMMMKNFRQAITEFMKVKYMIKTASPFEWGLTAMYNTALCYEELTEYDKALPILNEILKNHPNDNYGRQAKKVIERIEGKKNIEK
jgi:tetratricopeptide (TPR) repeat protein